MPSYFESGKGSLQRPEDHTKFSENFDKIFGKKAEKVLTDNEKDSIIQTEVKDQQPIEGELNAT